MKPKAVFLDIDGTLVDFQGKLPASAGKALKLARDKGHRLVLCTGRTRGQVYPWLLDFGFDGLITGAGARVEAEGNLLCSHVIPEKDLARAVDYFEEIRAHYYLQAEAGIYAPGWCIRRQTAVFQGEMTEEEREERFGKIFQEDRPASRQDVEKIAYYQSPEQLRQVRQRLGDFFTVEASSFQLVDSSDGEVTIRGIDKASGMEAYLEAAGISREDTYAFGDGPNDREMLGFAGTGVAMGNAAEELKRHADLVTAPLQEDGLYRAFEKLGLI